MASILGDCERLEMIIRSQNSAKLLIPFGLKQSLLNKSDEIPQAYRALRNLTTEVFQSV